MVESRAYYRSKNVCHIDLKSSVKKLKSVSDLHLFACQSSLYLSGMLVIEIVQFGTNVWTQGLYVTYQM